MVPVVRVAAMRTPASRKGVCLDKGGGPKYKSPLKRGRKTGNVLSNVLYHLDNTCQEKSRCRDGTPQLVLPSMIPPAPP